jgi:hypothetical protein
VSVTAAHRRPSRREVALRTVAVLVAVLVLLLAAFLVAERLQESGPPVSASACGESGGEAFTVPTGADDPRVRYAPLVFLHPRELRLPLSTECFIAHSRLTWASAGRGVVQQTKQGEVDAKRLGAADPYTSDLAGRPCEAGAVGCFRATDHTRPFDSGRGPLTGRVGFALDVDDAFRSGLASASVGPVYTGAPVYLQAEPGFITYWFFYGFSAAGGRFDSRGISTFGHEGDWERISVHLDEAGNPLEVAYFEHAGPPLLLLWAQTPRLDTHPIVFSGLGSHASYPAEDGPQQKRNADSTQVGRLWPTWVQIVDVHDKPWFGFGGAWGAAGIGPARLAKELTGPLGPSPYKTPAPAEWRR